MLRHVSYFVSRDKEDEESEKYNKERVNRVYHLPINKEAIIFRLWFAFHCS